MVEDSPQTILIIDDEANSRDLIERRLLRDYRVLTTGSGSAGLEILDNEPVDLVISDVMMPGLNGFEVCRRIRERNDDAFLPVILLTALNSQTDRNEGLAAGADDFLSKPVDSRELHLRVGALLRIRRQDVLIRAQTDSVKRANARLSAINHISAQLSSSLKTGDPAPMATTAILEAFDLELAAIATHANGRFQVECVVPQEASGQVDVLLTRPETQRAAREEQLQLGDGRDGHRVCWAPILDGEGVLGVLVLGAGHPGAFDDEDTRAISTIASQLGLALRNHEFVTQIRAYSEELESIVRKETESLERQVRFTHQIIDSLPVSLYVVDRDLTVVAWNKQRELGDIGVLRDKAMGQNLLELFPTPNLIEAELRQVFINGERLSFESQSTLDGETRHFRIHKIPMSLESGQVTHVLTIGEEITEQRQMERSLAMAEKLAAMGRLAAGVAHEVNNPLATILTCAEALQGRLSELPSSDDVSSDFDEYLGMVVDEAYRAKKITEGLLDFGRAKRSPRVLHDLENIVERTLSILKHHEGFKRTEVERRFEGDLPSVSAEEDAIVQVLLALSLNALDSMADGGRLTLTTGAGQGEVWCEVRDTGSGIGPADLGKIFEPFFTTKPAGRGTGLGLAVCYGIVQSHGGRIDVDSTPGKGSQFSLVLPAAEDSAAERKESGQCSHPSLSDC